MNTESPEKTGAEQEGDLSLSAFDHHPLTRVVCGAGTLARLGELVRELGGSIGLGIVRGWLRPARVTRDADAAALDAPTWAKVPFLTVS